MNRPISTGYLAKPHAPEHEAKLGDVWPVVNPTGDWTPYLPPLNINQDKGVETMACVSFAAKDAIELILKKQFGDDTVWSARWIAYISGTTKNGNDPATVAQAIKDHGLVPETDWPNDPSITTWEEWYKVPPQALYVKALEFKAKYAFDFRWTSSALADLPSNLMISPIPIAGYAWAEDSNGLYYTPEGAQPCHYFVLARVEVGKDEIVLDSYPNDVKKLRPDYQFSEAMQYRITKNVGNTPAGLSAWQRFLDYMQRVLGIGYYSSEKLGEASRSPEWRVTVEAFAEYVPKVCPFDGLTKVQLHHSMWPFHTAPAQELNPVQFRWACEGAGTHNHHLQEGHNGNFQSLNSSFDERVEAFQHRPLWKDGKWVPTDTYDIKYKMTQADLDAWNKRFGTRWSFEP